MRQRCENPNDPSYHNYGGRGIEFRFESVSAAIKYVLKELPHPTYIKLDIDRENNDGHYEAGNLRLATRKENLENRRLRPTTPNPYGELPIPRLHLYHVVRTLWPEVRYTSQVLMGLAVKGLSLEEMKDRYTNLKSCKPKGFTILQIVDKDIASLYLE